MSSDEEAPAVPISSSASNARMFDPVRRRQPVGGHDKRDSRYVARPPSAVESSSGGTPSGQRPPHRKETSASGGDKRNFSKTVVVRQEASREKLYEYIDQTPGELGGFLSSPDGWKKLIEMQEEFMENLEVDYLPYTSGFLGGFNLDDAVGMPRTKSEGAAGGTTAGQTHKHKAPLAAEAKKNQQQELDPKRKDAYHKERFNYHLTPANFKENDREICWLCSKPLIVNHLTGTPQSEHKPPCFSMALTGVGLAATERGKQINSGNRGGEGKAYPNEEFIEKKLQTVTVAGTSTPETGLTDNYKKYQTWKLLVRSESMAWSHPWCNNKKSQTPFISLRYKTLEGGGAAAQTVFMYVIEMDAIAEYLDRLANANSTKQRTNMNYQGDTAQLSGDYDPDFFGSEDKYVSEEEDEEEEEDGGAAGEPADGKVQISNRELWKKNALRNIVVGLIPLWCLLNQGFDIYGPVKELCQSLLARQDGQVRTFSELLNNNPLCSIRIRVKQNCARMVAREAAKEGSLVYQISESSGEKLDRLTKQLLGNFYGDAAGVVLGNVDQYQLIRVASESLQSAAHAKDSLENAKAKASLSSRLPPVPELPSGDGGGDAAAAGTTGRGGRKKTKRRRKKRKKRTRRKRKYRKKTRRKKKIKKRNKKRSKKNY